MFLLIVLVRRLLNRCVTKLPHGIYEWVPIPSGLSHKAKSQSMGTEVGWIKPGQVEHPFQNRGDRLWGSGVSPIEPSFRTSQKTGPDVISAN
jgi:hypothetical protein